ncbi:oxidoreductase [Sorangium cellulosum]|uniref:Oxidoreductase n=1 Tax=Sorangium cellulosum TaxID=56 RepID=A0A2L0FBX1_SORCE|nr:oxidoreductase [Sorangium cellulosum]AUX49007.1 oxidoreductase [Sorangium cellulosum]
MSSQRVYVGLIGYGLAGAVFHAPLIRAVPQLRLAAIATRREGQVMADHSGVAVHPTPETLIAEPGIDLVVIASPNETHVPLARAALEAGKHVVVDKPFTNTSAEADELIALAARRGRLLSAFQNRRWDADFRTVRRCIEQGLLGEVVSYEAHFDRFRPAIKQGWREQDLPGSGILYDLGAHLIDQALVLFGLPRAVTADLLAQRPEARTVDYFNLTLDYGRRRAIVRSSTLTREPGPRFAVHGDGGSFLKYGIDGQEEALKAGKRPGAPDWGREDPRWFGTLVTADGERRVIESLPGAYEAYYEGIAAAILDGVPPPVRAEEARDVIRIIEAATRSSAERRTIALDRKP